MPDLCTQMSRLEELTGLLLKMAQEPDNNKFWELDKRFKETQEIYKLEDEINKGV